MSPNYVTLVLNEFDAAGNPIISGTATLTPNSPLLDVTDQMDITPFVPQVTFRPGGAPQVKLLATDNANVSPSGWAWTLTFSGVPGNPLARSFFLPFSGGATQYLSALTTTPSPPASPTFFLPTPSGTATAGYVPIATGTGEASAWTALTEPKPGRPYVTVSPVGLSGGAAIANNGADYGPDTSGTTTSGIQEALTALQSTGGKIVLLQGAFHIASAMTYTSDYSLTIEGETRGRAENVTSSSSAWGVFLMVDSLASGVTALTITVNTLNLSMLRLSDFTMRGQALGYTGSSSGAMHGIALSGTNGSPAQVEIDNVAFEYVNLPLTIANGVNGPVIITWIGFFFCGISVDDALLILTTGTAWIGHIEAFSNSSPVVGIKGGTISFSFIDIASIFMDAGHVINFGTFAAAPGATYLNVGAVDVQNPVSGNGLVRLEASAGALYAHFGKVSWQATTSGQQGYIMEGTGQSTSGQVQVTIENLYGNPQYLVWNNYGSNVGSGSFLDVRGATFTQAPNADLKFGNMFRNTREIGSGFMQASLSGTTAGTAVSNFTDYGVTYKRFSVYLSGYENTTGTAQTITFPYPFTHAPAIMHDDSGGASVSTTVLTLPASMGSTKTGWITLEGF